MSKRYNRKPSYYKKSKTPRQIKEQYISELEEDESFTDTQSEFHGPILRRRKKYDYSEFEEDEGDKRYGYQTMYSYNNMYTTDNSLYNMEHDVDEYTSQMTMYNEPIRQKHWNERVYEQSDMESCDASDSDCKICSNGAKCKGKNSLVKREMNDYLSEYKYQQPKRYKSPNDYYKINRKKEEVYTGNETSPYRHNFNHVYIAQPSDRHQAFNYKQKQITDLVSSSEEESEGVPVKEKSHPVKKKSHQQNNSQYHVYAAEVPQDPTGIFNQGVGERLLSVTNYDANVPMMGPKDENNTDNVIKSDSGVVYLPVIVLDQAIKLSKNKVVPPEIILKSSEEKTQKPMETNMQVYATNGTEQDNIFKKEKDKLGEEVKALTFPQEMTTYVMSRTSGNPMNSVSSRAAGRNKENKVADYPVNKSYINVGSPMSSSENVKPTKSKLKTMFSTASVKSLFGRRSTSSVKDKKKTKNVKSKKKKDNQKTDDESETSQADNNPEELDRIATEDNVKDANKKMDTLQNLNQSKINKKTVCNDICDAMVGNALPPNIGLGIEETRHDKKKSGEIRNSVLVDNSGNTSNINRNVGDKKSMTDEKRKSIARHPEVPEFKKSIIEGKASILGGHASTSGGRTNNAFGNKKNSLGNQSIIGVKKSILGDKQQAHGDTWKSEPNIKPTREDLTALASEPIQKTEPKADKENKSLASKIIAYDRKKRNLTIDNDVETIPILNHKNENNKELVYAKTPDANNIKTHMPKSSVTDQSQFKPRKKSSKSLIKSGSTKVIEDKSRNTLKLWSYNIHFMEYIFQTVQFFLGMSLHDLVMEICHNYSH